MNLLAHKNSEVFISEQISILFCADYGLATKRAKISISYIKRMSKMSEQDSKVVRNMYVMAAGLMVFLVSAIALARTIVY